MHFCVLSTGVHGSYKTCGATSIVQYYEVCVKGFVSRCRVVQFSIIAVVIMLFVSRVFERQE